MKLYLALAGLVVAVLAISIRLVETLDVPLLTDPSPWLADGGVLAALVGMGMLVSDVVLPVPSSLVMIANGAFFGIAVGTLLSLVGSMGATLVAFGLGRCGSPLLARVVASDERARVNRLLDRWGSLAIVMTRPIPLLAETTAILAGASPMRWAVAALAALVGSFPAALVYAAIGATAATFEASAFVFGFVLLLAVSLWLATRSLGLPRSGLDASTRSGSSSPLRRT
jgi:uncharacterized membrane protein YdjX (TVP38/TMEM64 family)